jgi:hypothetical protein
VAQGRVAGVGQDRANERAQRPCPQALTANARIAELEHDLDAAQHLLHEIVIAAFRREHGRDPASKAEYRAYHRKLYEEAVAAMETRSDVPAWLTSDDE